MSNGGTGGSRPVRHGMIRYGSALGLVYPGLVLLGAGAGFLGVPWLVTPVIGMIVTSAIWYAVMRQISPTSDPRAKSRLTWYLLRGRTSLSTAKNTAAMRRLVLGSVFLPFCGQVMAGILSSDGQPNSGPDPQMVVIVGLTGFTLNAVIKLQEFYWDRFFSPLLHRREPLRRRIGRAWRKVVYRLRKPEVFPEIRTTHDYDWVCGRSPTLDRLARGIPDNPVADGPPPVGDAAMPDLPAGRTP